MRSVILIFEEREKQRAVPVAEYQKRLGKNCEILAVKPAKFAEPERCVAADSEKVLGVLGEKFGGWTKVLLHETGVAWTTLELAAWSEKQSRVLRVIGGSRGLDPGLLKSSVDAVLALGGLTLPHGLAKLVLMEQLYRIEQIRAGTKYHH